MAKITKNLTVLFALLTIALFGLGARLEPVDNAPTAPDAGGLLMLAGAAAFFLFVFFLAAAAVADRDIANVDNADEIADWQVNHRATGGDRDNAAARRLLERATVLDTGQRRYRFGWSRKRMDDVIEREAAK